MRVKYNKTGSRARAHMTGYHGTAGLDREFNIVTSDDTRDIPAKYYDKSPGGKYSRTKFAIGFEIEKLSIRNEEEYPIFRGYETDSSLNGSSRADRPGEAITNILPLVPNSNLKNKVMDLIAEASPILDGPVDSYCGGHVNLSCQGLTGNELKAKLKPFSGLLYALYRGRLTRRYANGDIFMNNSGYYRGVINAKSRVAEFRLPSAVPSATALMKRYSLFFELMDTAVHKPGTRFNTFLERCRPIIMRMYDHDNAKVEHIFDLARDFQRMINTGRISRRILEFLPERVQNTGYDNHVGRFGRIVEGEMRYQTLRIDSQ